MNDIRMQGSVSPFTPAAARTGLEENRGPDKNLAIEELKHSIRTHIVIMNGVTDQLCAYLLKLIDFLGESNIAAKEREIEHLSYSILEASAIYISGTIDSYATRYVTEGKEFPKTVKNKSDNVLVIIGSNRGNQNKLESKKAVLAAAADALNAFSEHTGMIYPKLVDIDGNQL